MDKERIFRAWKDRKFRAQLSKESEYVPEHPAGLRSLTDQELALATGAGGSWVRTGSTVDTGCCTIIIGDCKPPPV